MGIPESSNAAMKQSTARTIPENVGITNADYIQIKAVNPNYPLNAETLAGKDTSIYTFKNTEAVRSFIEAHKGKVITTDAVTNRLLGDKTGIHRGTLHSIPGHPAITDLNPDGSLKGHTFIVDGKLPTGLGMVFYDKDGKPETGVLYGEDGYPSAFLEGPDADLNGLLKEKQTEIAAATAAQPSEAGPTSTPEPAIEIKPPGQ